MVTYEQMLVCNRLGSPAVFWNRQMLELVGLFDTRYRWAADYDYWLRMWRRRPPEFLDQELGVFRHHGGNASQTHVAALEREAKKIASRQSMFGDIMERARNLLLARRVYGAAGAPESSSDLRGVI